MKSKERLFYFNIVFSKTFLLFIIFNNFLFAQNSSTQKNIVVHLEHKKFDDTFFIDNDSFYTNIKFVNLDFQPKYCENVKKTYKGVPENDSINYFGSLFDNSFMLDLNKVGDLSTENLNGYITGEDIDTLHYSKIKLKSAIIAVIGFNKNKQFIIADANRNKDFSDDIKYEYDINFRNNSLENIDYLNNLPITEYSYEDVFKGKFQRYDRRFILYPDRNNRFSISSRTNPKRDREYSSFIKFRDYWKGETLIGNKKFEFYYHGNSNRYGILFAVPKGTPCIKLSPGFDSQYCFKYFGNSTIDDTLRIAGNNFVIDSINRSIEKIFLRKVKTKNPYGYLINDEINDFVFTDLNNKKFKLKNSLVNKKYTLLEFWGTWCGPCVAMTPKLKKAYLKNVKNLNIISIATSDKLENVKNYVSKNHLRWKFGYIKDEKTWLNPIIKELKIKSYPTFLLLNSKGKIIARGSSDSLEHMLRLIE